MPIKYEQFAADLVKTLRPVYLIAGAEPLLVQECRDAVREAARQQGFLQRDILHVDRQFDWQTLAGVGNAPSLFADRRVIDLRMPTGKPGREGAAVLTEWAKAPDADNLLIVSCEQWDKSSRTAKWASALNKAGVQVDIWPVKPGELPGWIDRRMKRAGLEAEPDAVMILAERLEGNLLAAQQEIEKLALLKGQGRVSADDVLRSVADSSRFDAFLLAEHALAGNRAGCLRAASGLQRMGVPLQLVCGALINNLRSFESYRTALQAGQDEQQLFRRLNVWFTRQDAFRRALRRLSDTQLSAAFCLLALIDRQGKGRASGDPWHALDHLLNGLCA